ncbi:DUF6473 family protein [Roseovarius sp. Pro17]|uniref:DUF6473 family protein n=1 Tax=Roseovarius sp. Pro17 TaxID=3108175 RepID=UPI002D77CFB1|nr:DUF6473 family protein [Roseovarius sp. Pro17]
MAYEKLGATPLDYAPCRYGASKLLFRGPERALTGRYAAFLGGTETYGKFIRRPFPALVEDRLGAPCVNLGWPNAGADVFLHDHDVLAAASMAQVTVLQVAGAQNMSNRFYTVHPRRNDRFVQATSVLRAIFSEVDFTEFHFTRHMLGYLAHVGPDRFALLRLELQEAWVARMKLLVDRIDAPVVLLWMSSHPPQDRADVPGIAEDPAFVTCAMLRALAGCTAGIVDATANSAARLSGTQGMVHSEFEAVAAAELLGPAAHDAAAEALLPIMRKYLGD